MPKNELLIDAVTSSNALVSISIPKISEEPEHTPLGFWSSFESAVSSGISNVSAASAWPMIKIVVSNAIFGFSAIDPSTDEF